jgi:hypothetical protein
VRRGGLSPSHARWISSQIHFFLPVKALRRVIRDKFVAALSRDAANGNVAPHTYAGAG